MMKIEIKPAVLAKLEEIAEENRDLSPDEQERLAEKIGRDTPELCVKMRELFAEQAKKIYQSTQLAAALAPKLQPDVKAEVEAEVEVEVDSAIAEVVKVADDDSAKGWGKRRSLGEGEEQLSTSLALVLAEEEEEQEKEETHAEPARLNLSAPYDVAKVFVIRNNGFIGKIEGELVRKPTLWFWQREFWAWNGCCYQMVEEDEVRAKVYDFLDRSVELDGRALKPKPRNVSEVIDGLKAGANIKIAEAPTWLGVEGLPEAKGFLVCRNGLVEFETGKLRKHDPRFFGINSVDFDFDPTARAPRFEKFLKEVWPNDEETVATLQEFFGLWLTDVTKYQKACVLIGPPRSGKGTIGRVVKGLLGRENYAAVSLQALGTDSFGMEHLIGKKLALVPDVKLDGRANITQVMERLLTTIGEDEQAINRKNMKYWLGRLGIRWLILGNDVPKFRGTDEAGALASRCVMLEMKEDFLGREDFDLTDKLLTERAGILNWAIAGWRRLKDRGRFVQPATGSGLMQKLRASTSTMGAFVDECCVIGTQDKVLCDALWLAFCEWSERHKLPVTIKINTFSGMLRRNFPEIVTTRPSTDNIETRPRWFYGVGLRNGWRRPSVVWQK